MNAQFAGKQSEMRSERRDLLEEELKGISAVLTPEQRDKIKDFCEDQIVVVEVRTAFLARAQVSNSRVETRPRTKQRKGDDRRADRGYGRQARIDGEQRTTIRGINAALAEKFKSQRDQRKVLRAEEWKAFAEILTPEQREKAKDLVEDKS